MVLHFRLYCTIAVVVLLSSCGEVNRGGRSGAEADTTALTSIAPAESAGTVAVYDTSRKLVRTVSFDCRTPDVFSAMTRLEAMVRSVGGLVEESRLEHRDHSTTASPVGTDSLRQVRIYQATGSLTVKLPAVSLDTLLNFIPAVSSFIENRHMEQKDVSLAYLEHTLYQQAANSQQVPSEAFTRANKTDDVLKADSYREGRQAREIEQRLAGLRLLQQVSFATVHLKLTQPLSTDVQIVLNPDAVTTPGYGQRLAAALQGSWRTLLDCSLLLVRLTPAVVILTLLVGCFRGPLRRRLRPSGKA